MDNQEYNSIVSFIWGIADDCLRDVYVRGKYRDVILPMTVIRRLDAMLEGTKEAVLTMKKQLDAAKIDNQWPALCNAAGQAFCNASPFLLKDLTSRSKKQTLEADFKAYLDGFSPNVQEILDKFKFRDQIKTMVDADILGAVIEKFTSSDINLSPNPVYKDAEKKIVKLPGLDNHGMGTIFEELIRRFNEENNEEAGEHWTPRDVVELMADLAFYPVEDKILDATYSSKAMVRKLSTFPMDQPCRWTETALVNSTSCFPIRRMGKAGKRMRTRWAEKKRFLTLVSMHTFPEVRS